MSWLWAVVVGAGALLTALHALTHGRSSPLAALVFVLAGPVLGVLAFLPEAAANRADSNRAGSDSWGKIYGLTPDDYLLTMTAIGTAAAACVALAFTSTIWDEVRARRATGARTTGRPAVSAALQALGLNAFATLDDVERAYREQAKRLHPDRGGDPREFKRLQGQYERAKQSVRRGAKRPDDANGD